MARIRTLYPIDTGRLRNVVELVTDKAGWGRQVPPGHGLGLAVHRSFVTYVAAVVEAAVDEKGNADRARASTWPSTAGRPSIRIASARRWRARSIMGLRLAMKSEISFKDGRVQQSNFDDYQVTAHRRGAEGDPRATSCLTVTTYCREASANPACRRSPRRSSTRSTSRPANAFARCRSASNR